MKEKLPFFKFVSDHRQYCASVWRRVSSLSTQLLRHEIVERYSSDLFQSRLGDQFTISAARYIDDLCRIITVFRTTLYEKC
jgi:hypothetical protein